MTNQLTREEAIYRLKNSEMSDFFLEQEFEFIASKLDLSTDELRHIFEAPRKTFKDYKNKRDLIIRGANLMRKLGLEKRYFK